MAVPAAKARGLDTGHTLALVGRVTGYTVLAILGAWGIGEALSRSNQGFLVFAAFLTAVGLLGFAWAVLETRHLRARPGAALGRSPVGSAALVVARATWMLVIESALCLALAAALVVGGVLALLHGHGSGGMVIGIPLLLAGGLLLALLGPVASGSVRSGAVYLTPEGVEHRVEGSWWRVPWDDIQGVLPDDPVALVLQPGAHVERGRTTRWGWNREVRGGEGLLGIATRYLALDGAVLGFLLLSYLNRPHLRASLGTPDSLDWRILREED